VAAPARAVGGLARARVYGRVRLVGNGELFLPGSTGAFHAGWPALAAHFARAGTGAAARDAAIAWLREALPPALTPVALDLLRVLAAAPAPALDPARLSVEERETLAWLAPLARPSGGRWRLAGGAVPELLRAALAERAPTGRAGRLAEAGGRPDLAIGATLAAGRRRAALAILARHGGMMFGHLHGPEAVARVLDAFGDDPAPDVVGLRIQSALKAGRTERARHLLDRAAEGRTADLDAALSPDSGVPVPFALAEILMATYQGRQVGPSTLARLPGLLGRIGDTAHLSRGVVWNAATDLHLRAGRHVEARQALARALRHYRDGGAPYLEFYMHVHEAMIALRLSEGPAAERALAAARDRLAATPFEVPQDERLLALLDACLAYERGEPEPMAAFAETIFEGFAYGEFWPAVSALAMRAGAEALALTAGTERGLDHLRRWRALTVRSRQDMLAIERAEARLLQTALRWREAHGLLSGMATRIGRVWMDSSGEELADLRGVEDIAQALAWLRSQVLRTPRHRSVGARLAALAGNPALSWRQRTALALWQAWAARRTGRVQAARATVLEERVVVRPLLDDARLRGGPMRGAPVPESLGAAPGSAFGSGALSRQEWRALMLLAEGCANKEIARELDVSLPTVKFHLKNLYAKLGVRDRRAAVAEARGRGLLED
jgi:DNA-binding CsgD family transcriptional regulator